MPCTQVSDMRFLNLETSAPKQTDCQYIKGKPLTKDLHSLLKMIKKNEKSEITNLGD